MYVQKLEKGKLQEVEAQREQMARSQKLEEIQKLWPKMVPLRMKEDLIRQFRRGRLPARWLLSPVHVVHVNC